MDINWIVSKRSIESTKAKLSDFNINDTGCHIYNGRIDYCGYGVISIGKHRIGAHKVSYIINNGEVPDGFVLMHSCDNRACINPDHLIIGSQRENIIDCISKGRRKSGKSMPVIAKPIDESRVGYWYPNASNAFRIDNMHRGKIKQSIDFKKPYNGFYWSN